MNKYLYAGQEITPKLFRKYFYDYRLDQEKELWCSFSFVLKYTYKITENDGIIRIYSSNIFLS